MRVWRRVPAAEALTGLCILLAVAGGPCEIPADADGDGIPDAEDNCPVVFNPDQADADGNGVGNACEVPIVTPTDTDGDGILDDGDNSGVAGDHPCTGGNTGNCDDNCVDTVNSDQSDADSDGVGDACQSTSGEVAFLKAEKYVGYADILGTGTVSESENFVFCVYFNAAVVETPEGSVSGGFLIESEEFGDCTVTTAIPAGDPGASLVLDPGSPGVATNGTVSVDLMPHQPGEYFANQPDLMSLGFDAGQIITFSFPGGTDIDAFTGSTEVLADLVLTSPDLTDPNLTLDRNSALNLAWIAGDPSDTVQVVVFSTTQEQTHVSVSCECADTGSTTVPADVMSHIPLDSVSISLTVSRIDDVEVNLPLKVGNGIARLRGMASVGRTWLESMLTGP